MTDIDKWYSGKIGGEDNLEFVRFNYSQRHILDDTSYSKAIWFETQGVETSDADSYLVSLDTLEESIKRTMESNGRCHLVLTLTGTGYRDLVFAFSGQEIEVDAHICYLLQQYPERFNVKVRSREFGPYPALVSQLNRRLGLA